MAEGELTTDSIISMSVTLVILTFLIALVRFLITVKLKSSFGADGIWLLLSLATFYIYQAIVFWAVAHDLNGKSIEGYTITFKARLSGKLQYAATPLRLSTVATAKFSILCLYRRIFSIDEKFRRDSLIIGLLVACYWIGSVLGFLLRCSPVRGGWQTDIQSSCINTAAIFLGWELLNCILDLAILWLPLRMISGLQMPLKRKFGLAIVFTLGSLVFGVGVVRMARSYRANSRTVAFAPNFITASLENGLAIICACLPVCAPVLSRNTYTSLASAVRKLRAVSLRRTRSSSADVDDKKQLSQPGNLQHGPQDAICLRKASAVVAIADDTASAEDYSPGPIPSRTATDIV